MGILRYFARFFRNDRRAAIAITMAVLTVPLLVISSAAVDMSRIMTARAILQAAADSAATAGAGAWGTSSSATNANTVATQAFNSYSGIISGYAPLVSGSPSISLVCGVGVASSSLTSTCGSVTSYSTTGLARCNNPCVFVNASVNVANTLLGTLAHLTTISVTAAAGAVLEETVNSQNIPPSPGFGSAGDHSDIYAYAVGSGSGTGYDYGHTPPPNQNCGTETGTISLLPETSQTGSTACNYLFIADSTSAGTSGSGGSITLAQGQPIAFTFIDDTGGSGYTGAESQPSTTELVVSIKNGSSTIMAPTFEQGGYTINTYTTTVVKASCSNGGYLQSPNYTSCSSGNYNTTTSSTTARSGTTGTTATCTTSSNGNCSKATITTVSLSSPAASAYCPANTLYGSLSSGYGAPAYDNISQYSSAPEVLGYPPTYPTNHALVPFLSTSVSSTSFSNGDTVNVQAFCPNYSLSGTNISAPINSAYATAIANYYTSGSATYGGKTISNIANINNINIYSTAFPGVNFVDPANDQSGIYNGTSSNATPTTLSMAGAYEAGDVFPPAIAGCTPAIATEDNNAAGTSANPWWNWNGSNSGNCSTIGKTDGANYFASGQPAFGNCALLIQQLGTSVPTVSVTVSGVAENEAIMPDYYLLVSSQPPSTTTAGTIVALDPVWDGQTFTDTLGSVITGQITALDSNITLLSNGKVQDQDTGPTFTSGGNISTYGFTPSYSLSSNNNYYKLVSGTYVNDYVIMVQPAANGNSGLAKYDFNPPYITSSKCYDPQKNGNPPGSAILATGPVTNGTTITYNTTYSTSGDQNNGSLIDAVANPQLGAIVCTSDPPETYALYWNDLGTYGSDDLGYWNAVFSFTCPVAGSTTGGGPVTIFQ